MKKKVNECVNCGLPCLGSSCPNRNVIVICCDECEEETDIYRFDDEELCIDCIIDRLEKVED